MARLVPDLSVATITARLPLTSPKPEANRLTDMNIPSILALFFACLLPWQAVRWLATNVIAISGASREMTEGVASLFAAAVLVFVGIWMHNKSQAGGHAIIVGSLAAVFLLALIAWSMLRLSARLPIAQFFSFSAVLMAILAVVLTGKGIAAVQEAGWLSAELVSLPRIEWVGLYPTMQGVLAQVVCMAVLVTAFVVNRRMAGRARASRESILIKCPGAPMRGIATFFDLPD